MNYVKYNKRGGIVDAETGKQLLLVVEVNATKKYRDMACKLLVAAINEKQWEQDQEGQ